MAIDDVDVPGSDGWLMQQAWLLIKARRRWYTLLENYRRGTAPVHMGSTNAASAFYRFQRQCRTNVADLAVQALVERLAVRTIRTAAGSDDDGDVQATRMWQASGMGIAHPDVLRMLATFGRAFTSMSAPVAEGAWSRIVAEDPRDCAVLYGTDDAPIAGFKLLFDPLTRFDYAILWLPGRKVVAWAEKGTPPAPVREDRVLPQPRLRFDPSRFDIRPERPGDAPQDGLTTPLWSETYEVLDIPVVEHVAPDGVGVYERHLDLIDQINHVILQGLVISTLQAFKQRAIELVEPLPRTDPETGVEIDYNNVFSADPGALWELPVGAKIWESGQVDVTGILNQAKDAIQRFAAVLRLPFSMFSSDSVNQSAEGAQLTREGLVFKAEDFQRVENHALVQSLSIAFKFMPDTVRYADINGAQVDRADPAGMAIDWLPAERYSLAEKAQADAQALSLSRRQKLRLIWQLTPTEVDVTMGQVREDAMIDAAAKLGQGQAGAPAGAPATG